MKLVNLFESDSLKNAIRVMRDVGHVLPESWDIMLDNDSLMPSHVSPYQGVSVIGPNNLKFLILVNKTDYAVQDNCYPSHNTISILTTTQSQLVADCLGAWLPKIEELQTEFNFSSSESIFLDGFVVPADCESRLMKLGYVKGLQVVSSKGLVSLEFEPEHFDEHFVKVKIESNKLILHVE